MTLRRVSEIVEAEGASNAALALGISDIQEAAAGLSEALEGRVDPEFIRALDQVAGADVWLRVVA